ncbi:MAG: hypothetical protein OEW11_09445, partial [Nitrospirota bacterium]|nr:hypothetical protein [Nitrospirota bacterium]
MSLTGGTQISRTAVHRAVRRIMHLHAAAEEVVDPLLTEMAAGPPPGIQRGIQQARVGSDPGPFHRATPPQKNIIATCPDPSDHYQSMCRLLSIHVSRYTGKADGGG